MKRRLRKLFCLFCALWMTAQLLPAPSRAASSVFFTAVNDRLLELNDASMPFLSDGVYYLPHTIFTTADTKLGIYYSRNRLAQTVTLYTGGDSLVFHLDDGTVTDGKGKTYSYKVIARGDYLFFPMTLLTEYFGLRCTLLSTSYAPLLRIKNGSAALSDRVFLDAADSLLKNRYTQYLGTLPDSGKNDTPPSSGSVSNAKYRFCLAYAVTDQEACSAVLDQLELKQWQGLFLFEPQTLEDYPDLLRRITAGGHSVGFLAQDISEQELQQANRRLSLLTGGKTRALYLTAPTAETTQALSRAGYCLLSPAGNYAQTDLSRSANVTSLIRTQRSASSIVLLYLGTDSDAAESCSYFFRRLSSNLCRSVAWRETL